MELSPPISLDHHYSRTTLNRQPSAIKKFYKYFLIPGMGNFAGGLPNPGYFPYDTLEAKAARPDRFKPTPNNSTVPQPQKTPAAQPTSHVLVPHDLPEPDPLRKIDLATALQYGQAQGYPPLHAFLKEFALKKLHPQIPYSGGADIILTCGSTDGFSKLAEAFFDPWHEDHDWLRDREGLLCEEFAYGMPFTATRPKGVNIVPVTTDGEGMLAKGPGGLADVLDNWDRTKGKIPHVMYTITMGQNPTGGLLSLARRREIYAICQKYDILIVEDDPYWYLQYPSANQLSVKYRGKPVSANIAQEQTTTDAYRRSSGYPFLDSLVPSYLSIDTDGRVFRLDTFSKTIAPGCRLGWITAQPEAIERILQITECSTQQPSGFVQSLVSELIIGVAKTSAKTPEEQSSGWQVDGWVRWLEGLRGNYERRMQTMSQILEAGKYNVSNSSRRRASSVSDEGFEIVSKSLMYDFDFPMAGMFLWLHNHFESHPLFGEVEPTEMSTALWILLMHYKVLLAPGTMFAQSQALQREKGWRYFRICFAAVEEDEIAIITKRAVEAYHAFWAIEDVNKIHELADEANSDSVEEALEACATTDTDKSMMNAMGC